MAANEYQANISQGSISVDIILDSIEIDMNKQLTSIDLPKQSTPDSILVDLKKLKEAVSFSGFLEDSTESALTKARNLRTLMQTQGLKTLTWNSSSSPTQESRIGNINSLKIKQVLGRIGNEGTDTKTFTVQMIFFVGSISKG